MTGDLKRAVIVPAAGSGTRLGAPRNKLLEPLAGDPILLWTLRAVARVPLAQVVLVTRPDERDTMADLAARAGLRPTFADGGPTRQASVVRGLRELAEGIDLVAVHDAARPLVTPELFEAAFASAAEHGSGIVAVPQADSLKRVDHGRIIGTVSRDGLWAMQTPQAAQAKLLTRAAKLAAVTGFEGTDEAGLLEAAGIQVRVVPGSAANLKITRREDLALAAKLLGVSPRIGFGYDIHELVPGRELWLGGVRIESPLGLLGHSDADVLLHAICDALLGALGDGDIGRHFPNTDPRWEGIASLRLLEATAGRMRAAGYAVGNIDATVIAQQPKIAPHQPAMREAIAAVLGVRPERIGIKATTNEGLDDLGAGRGIAAQAVALLVPDEGEV